MKLLTINTHSLQEADPAAQLESLAQFLLREQPDVAALQEVSQSRSAEPSGQTPGMVPMPTAAVPVRQDNFALNLALRLGELGLDCYWVWLPAKIGYDRFDEGLALFSKKPIARAESLLLSARDDYRDWQTRKIPGVRLAGGDWFYSVHMGWWEDADCFRDQWRRLEAGLAGKSGRVWLMGDFNSPDSVREQGYDLMVSSGWHDTAAGFGGVTVPQAIDGWRDRPGAEEGMRIDYIWCSQAVDVRNVRVVLNGLDGDVISDHFGVLVDAEL